MGRKLLGVFFGLVAGILLIIVLQGIGHRFWPLPEGLDPADRDAVAAAIRAMPVPALLWVAFSWFAGTLCGTFVALRMAKDVFTSWPALVVEAVLLTVGVLNLFALPHPGWFWVVGLISFPLGAFAGIRLARRTAPAA